MLAGGRVVPLPKGGLWHGVGVWHGGARVVLACGIAIVTWWCNSPQGGCGLVLACGMVVPQPKWGAVAWCWPSHTLKRLGNPPLNQAGRTPSISS